MITIKNDYLTAKINEVGAELKSLVCNDTQYIWTGDERFWAGSAPLLFPICSGLKDDEYYLDGKKYTLQKHGYARFCKFEVENQVEDSVTFLLCSNEESLKQFPFRYELRVTYTLENKTLKVKYDVKNLSDDTMYFSIGAHEGYYCPEGIEEYDVILPEAETLYSTVLEGNVLGNNKVRIIENSDRIALKYDYFAVDALVFKDMKARSAVLKNRNNGKAVKVTFEGCDYFLLWTKPDAPYICLEPWCGISDNKDTDKNFKTKEGIRQIAAGGNFVNEHSIEVLDNGGK
ncbi:MAG: aldose 1-epimerase family protein [Acutalibacteraceae bacterium]|nr:aldose 1-epimerase family protein [Acutalibacteraceae bacterium]